MKHPERITVQTGLPPRDPRLREILPGIERGGCKRPAMAMLAGFVAGVITRIILLALWR